AKGYGPKRLHGGAKLNHSTAGMDVVSGRAIQFGERHGWNSHAPGGRRFKKRLAHHLGRSGDGNLIEVFVQGADQYRLPETLDGLPGLSVAFEPAKERLTLIGRSSGSEHSHGATDGQLVAKAQTLRPEECQRGMQRRRQRRRCDDGCASSGLEERQLLIPANLVLNARAAIEIEQVGAAAKQYMLAIIDNFASTGMLIRGRAPTEIGAAFKQRDAKTGFCQNASSGQASQPASGDSDCGRICRIRMDRIRIDRIRMHRGRHQCRRFRIPFPRTVSFSGTVNRTRSPKTSYWFAAIFSSKRR